MGRRHRRKSEERAVARGRIERLFELAHRRVLEDEPELADRSVALARRIAMRYQTGLRPAERDRVCRGCRGYLAPGRTARVRVQGGIKRVTCLRCGTVRRRPYLREQKARRAGPSTPPAHDREERLPAPAAPAEPLQVTPEAPR